MTATLDGTVALAPMVPATLRQRVTVPLRFPDGYATTAEVMTFHGLVDGQEHLLLAFGAWEQSLLGAGANGDAPLVRLHSECMTGDVFGSERCDCGPQLREAVERIAGVGGFLLYLRQEGRGIGLYSKLDAYALQDAGLDTYDANVALGRGEDERDYAAAAQMLEVLGASAVRLLSNNPDKGAQLQALGIRVVENVPTGVHLSEANKAYLMAKRDKTGHALELAGSDVGRHSGPDADGLLGRIDALLPSLRERASEAEELRKLPEATMRQLAEAGVFRMLAPAAVGGYSLGIGAYAEALRRMARGCASTAWIAGHLAEHAWMLARWPSKVQDEVFAGGQMPLAAATGAPPGTATKVPGGFSLSGRWSFASGIMHSTWALLAANSEGRRVQVLVPAQDLELLDTWHTSGLRGTGSNDLVAVNVFVPEHRVMDWDQLSATDNPGSRLHPDSLVHAPMATLLNVVAPSSALGAAEEALNLFRERLMVRKVKNTTDNRQADSVLAQARYSEAYGLVTTARLHWQEAVQILSDALGRSDALLTDVERSGYRLSLALSAEAAGTAVRLIASRSGGSAHRLSDPLQRIQRDMDVLLNHPTLSLDPVLEQAGRGLLGLGLTVPSF
ncbi:GTP cyclohydrolase II RibA [Paenarthrobacter sp. NPDC018779]|uniref:GTP cyclohydrolase II RibA n=1 Tax=Paenarthrobacter sp. NPDC018779 TaxID=3364375 RepID=UPI0037C7AAF6